LTQKRGVCLIKFDDHLGPDCIYQEGLDNRFAQKVCMKSHLGTLSLSSEPQRNKGEFIESIIPFVDEGYVAYSTFFFVDDSEARGGKRILGIVTLVDRSEQMFLYKSIPEISATVKEIASEIAELSNTSSTLNETIKSKLNQLLYLEELKIDFDTTIDSVALIKERIKKQSITTEQSIIDFRTATALEGSFEFIFQKINSGLDKIIYALLMNEHIIVLGKKDEIALALATLKWFLPHKKLYNDLWIVPLMDAEALFSRTKDRTNLHVLGILKDEYYNFLYKSRNSISKNNDIRFFDIPQKNILDFSFDGRILIDLETGIVKGGISNRFCAQLADSIENRPYDESIGIINQHIDYLLNRVNDLINLVIINSEKDLLDQFINNAIEGEISLIITIINETNPLMVERIIAIFAQNKIPLEILF